MEQMEEERPELDPFQLEMYYHWTELDSCRHYSEIERRIPWTAIWTYAENFVQIDNLDDFEYFLGIIRSVDDFYLKWMNEKRVKDIESQQKKMEREMKSKGRARGRRG